MPEPTFIFYLFGAFADFAASPCACQA